MRDPRMEAFVQQVRAATDILAVVQGYVPLRRKGARYWGCCPFHSEKTPSFSVVPAEGFFYCFGCHAGGDAFKFISLMEHITPFEAILRQAEQLGIPVPERKRDAREEARLQAEDDLRRVNALARDFFHNCLTVTHYGAAGKAYLAGRGIADETIERYGIGFAPDAWAKLADAFRKRGIPEKLLLDAGLCAARERGGIYDRFRGRVIIPITDERGRVVGFGGRALGDAVPKYLNTAETPVFNKRKLLFGLDRAHRAIASEGFAIVVEGYMDAIAVAEAGVTNVVATLGTAFTSDHAALLLRRAPRIVFCYDSDAAGQEATLRALAAVRGRAAEVRVLLLPDGKDPDEYIRAHGADAFRALIETALPAPEYRLRRIAAQTAPGVEGQRASLREMLPVLAALDGVTRGAYVRRTAAELFLDEGIVTDALQRFLRQGGTTEPHAGAEPVRQAVRRPDTAAARAGRELIAAVWRDVTALTEIAAAVPLAEFPDAFFGGILQQAAAHTEAGGALDADFIAGLDAAAGAEISRAVVEEGRTEASYRDALRSFRRTWLGARLARHTRRAEEMMKEGKPAYIDELNEVKKIQDEISSL